MIYLDYAATTPMSEAALYTYQEIARRGYGNSNSLHDIGNYAADIVRMSQNQLAEKLHVNPQHIHFTNGGTHANQLGVELLLQHKQKQGRHIIASGMEHKSINDFLENLRLNKGYDITYLPATQAGIVDTNQLQHILRSDTVLVIVQHINSEIGAIQPIEEIAGLLKEQQILFHCDGIQAFGKLAIDLAQLPIDSYSISSHKIYGPKGIGAVYLNPQSVQLNKLDIGTLDVPSIAAFATAASSIVEKQNEEWLQMQKLRDSFVQQLKTLKFPLQLLTYPNQLPSIIGILFDEIPGDYAMLAFNQAGIAISTGSACTVGNQMANTTLLNLGYTEEVAKRFVRISLGKTTTMKQLEKVIQVCENMITKWYST
ncbi:putative cysteine desulfurase NifS [Paraliobacillus ryukyuensis]|uniref:Cysteine desulfurase n=1 Tax=Paraliobacillus ryukyuensis TaxID=200904 RepID=A0A366DRH1_9BACI|nr:IscS subfamily cysteine desulfurase [Paraliobacillus ryukyuensis]RBO92079.1 cysteine desulfurase [Paraliobacillus ryukyuensis]